MLNPTSLILFDLDGTLLDTAPDLGAALNFQRAEHNLPPIPQERIRPVVSHGSPALLKLGFGIEPNDSRFAGMRARLLDIYRDCLSSETSVFPGVEAALLGIEKRGLRWGIVTNKPGALTGPLLQVFNLQQRAACVVSGDTTPRRKPHPDQLLHACSLTGCSPDHSIYVGDAQRDVEAAHAAGMRALVALYGYIDAEESPTDWQADGVLSEPLEILPWLDAYAGPAVDRSSA
ncbi:MAG: phosphoglycolate phosphatase [Gammaproteobacteria bacterium]|nr:phosphoglycolate phosphatase [Gammaproteobacteria bacterium]MDE2345880.1 phosphoglycolate phosphatase [Gammaproteobacteria bacterium]